MSDLQAKRVCDSEAEMVQIILHQHINGYGRLFGGQLVEWIDIVAAVVARRHSGHEVTTVTIDNLQFKNPVHANSTVVLKGKITYVGNTSMEIRVDTFVERLNGDKKLVNTAYIVMVALDEERHPVKVCPLIVESEEEKVEFEAGKRRYDLRKHRQIEQY